MAAGSECLPWRRPPRSHFPGVPAWGVPTAVMRQEPFTGSPLPAVTPGWAWARPMPRGCDLAEAGLCSLIPGKHPRLTPFQPKAVVYQAASNLTTTAGGARASE